MTKEEATAYIKEWLKDEYLDSKDRAALTAIIEESEQEPKYCDRNICIQNEYNGIGCDECEVTKSGEPYIDAVSRQAAIVQLSHNKTGDDDCDVIIQRDIETIKALPPVNPQTKTGHWIDACPIAWECSECHYIVNRPNNTLFCPDCGAKMFEPQGSEDKA